MDRFLAIDYGTVRIGLALTDPLKITAQPLDFLPNDEQLLPSLAKIIQEKLVSRIILGNPLKLNGQSGIAAEKVAAFAALLQEKFSKVQVILWDERLTSKEAEKTLLAANIKRQARKNVIDSMAAAILLQNYLQAAQL